VGKLDAVNISQRIPHSIGRGIKNTFCKELHQTMYIFLHEISRPILEHAALRTVDCPEGLENISWLLALLREECRTVAS
jgi:hypothetical protein